MEGKRLYNLYCDHCHGENGGAGTALADKWALFPSLIMADYKDRY